MRRVLSKMFWTGIRQFQKTWAEKACPYFSHTAVGESQAQNLDYALLEFWSDTGGDAQR